MNGPSRWGASSSVTERTSNLGACDPVFDADGVATVTAYCVATKDGYDDAEGDPVTVTIKKVIAIPNFTIEVTPVTSTITEHTGGGWEVANLTDTFTLTATPVSGTLPTGTTFEWKCGMTTLTQTTNPVTVSATDLGADAASLSSAAGYSVSISCRAANASATPSAVDGAVRTVTLYKPLLTICTPANMDDYLAQLTDGDTVKFGDAWSEAQLKSFGTKFREMFDDTFHLSLDFTDPSLNCQSIDSRTFEGCTCLRSVNIGNSIRFTWNRVFADCINLTSVTISAPITSLNSSTFSGCFNLTDVTLPATLTEIANMAFLDCYNLRCLVIPASVNNIVGSAFAGCTELSSVTFENTVGWKAGDTDVDVSDPETAASVLLTTGLTRTDP